MAGRTDTIVKARYSRGGKAALKLAKGHLRYAVHRTNEQGQRQYREVWDRDGTLDKETAYERLDQIQPADYVYRFTLSPHPERQDAASNSIFASGHVRCSPSSNATRDSVSSGSPSPTNTLTIVTSTR